MRSFNAALRRGHVAVTGTAALAVRACFTTNSPAQASSSSSSSSSSGRGGSSSSSSSSWRAWASAGFATGAAIATSVAITAVAAKAPDTPDYLLPYYLRSARARFNHYASIREKGGLRFMTTEDFVAAMLCAKDSSSVNAAAAEELETLFKETDANSDGRISFREFSFLLILLCTKPEDFRLGFAMFDEEKRGGLTRGEFKRLVKVFGDETMKPTMSSGLVHAIFDTGKFVTISKSKSKSSSAFDKKKVPIATLEQFEAVIADLRKRINVAEFRTQDTEKTGRISRRAFGELLTNSILGRHLPFFMVDNLRRMNGNDSSQSAVTLDSWLVFNELLRNSSAVSEALSMYAANGLPVMPGDFHRAVRSAGCVSRPLTDGEVQLIFEIFDRDGDGSLEYDEFASVMRNKAAYNVIEPEKDRNGLFAQLAKCTQERFAGGADDDDAADM